MCLHFLICSPSMVLYFCSIQAKSATLPFNKYKMENICNGNRKKISCIGLPDNLPQYKCRKIEQGYLSSSPVVRVRMDNDEYYLTYKGKGLLAREEYNLPLTKESYEHLIKKADGNIITKKRYEIPDNSGHTIELDIFEGVFSGTILAEVEFDSVEEAESYNPPAWFKEDVTMNKMYHNSNMSMLDVSHINTGNGE